MKGRERPSLEQIQRRIKNDWVLYALILPVLAWYFLFCYLPIAGGLSLSIRKFRFDGGIWNSPIIGMAHFQKMFRDREFIRATTNTVIISLGASPSRCPAPSSWRFS